MTPRHFQSITIFLGWAKAYLSRASYIVLPYRKAPEIIDLPCKTFLGQTRSLILRHRQYQAKKSLITLPPACLDRPCRAGVFNFFHPGDSPLKPFRANLFTAFCKLDRFSAMEK